MSIIENIDRFLQNIGLTLTDTKCTSKIFKDHRVITSNLKNHIKATAGKFIRSHFSEGDSHVGWISGDIFSSTALLFVCKINIVAQVSEQINLTLENRLCDNWNYSNNATQYQDLKQQAEKMNFGS